MVRRANAKYWSPRDEAMMCDLESGLDQMMLVLSEDEDYDEWQQFMVQVDEAINQLALLYIDKKDGNDMMSLMRSCVI